MSGETPRSRSAVARSGTNSDLAIERRREDPSVSSCAPGSDSVTGGGTQAQPQMPRPAFFSLWPRFEEPDVAGPFCTKEVL
jgi:hypothetical protein